MELSEKKSPISSTSPRPLAHHVGAAPVEAGVEADAAAAGEAAQQVEELALAAADLDHRLARAGRAPPASRPARSRWKRWKVGL